MIKIFFFLFKNFYHISILDFYQLYLLPYIHVYFTTPTFLHVKCSKFIANVNMIFYCFYVENTVQDFPFMDNKDF